MSFKKSPHISTQAPVRSSDRRKLCASISDHLGCPLELVKESLLPDPVLLAKFTTHLDTPGSLYSSPTSGNPLWFSLGKASPSTPLFLVPTVFTLSQAPTLLPTITTHPQVFHFLISGSDLMIPGLARPPSDMGLKQGDLVAVMATGCDVPLGVGRMALDASAIASSGRKGKAVEMLHCWRDHLWETGKDKPAIAFTLPSMDDDDETDDDSEEAEDVVASTPPRSKSPLPDVAALDISSSERTEEKVLSPSDVDTILRLSLLQYLSTLSSPTPAGTFPMPASQLYSLLLPLRPHYSPASAIIAKSSYKKVSKFVNAMQKEGLIKLKTSKGEDVVVSADFKSPAIKGHEPFGTVGQVEAKEKRKAAAAAAVAEGSEPSPSSQSKGKSKMLEIKELWKPSRDSMSFWSTVDAPSDTGYTTTQIRSNLLSYVTSHNLTHPRDPGFVLLDDALSSALLKKGESVEFLRRDEAVDRLRANMTCCHSIGPVGEDRPLKKGSPPRISISSKKRQAKHVTLVAGLEAYSVDPKEFAEELKLKCASSTSVAPLQSAPAKSGLVEVLVQGTHERVVIDLLAARGVPKKWIDTGGGGKGK